MLRSLQSSAHDNGRENKDVGSFKHIIVLICIAILLIFYYRKRTSAITNNDVVIDNHNILENSGVDIPLSNETKLRMLLELIDMYSTNTGYELFTNPNVSDNIIYYRPYGDYLTLIDLYSKPLRLESGSVTFVVNISGGFTYTIETSELINYLFRFKNPQAIDVLPPSLSIVAG